jgi:hypothetical protein
VKDQVAGIQVPLQASSGADGDEIRRAHRRQLLQRRSRRRRSNPELAQQPDPASGARQGQNPVQGAPALGRVQSLELQYMVVKGSLIAEHDTSGGPIIFEVADLPQVGGEVGRGKDCLLGVLACEVRVAGRWHKGRFY